MSEVGNQIGGLVGDVAGGIADPLANHFQAQSAATPEMLDQANMHTQTGLMGQKNLAQALSQQQGIGNQQTFLNQQQNLADMLYRQASGQGGPNPAQAALNQQTSNNINQQAALMAGQRGAGANAGMIARQAALQGGNLQQQAVGQGATLQAQQQIAAQQQLAAQQQAMQQVAGNQIANQMASQNAYAQGAMQNQGNLIGANNAANQINAGVAQGNAQMRGQIAGGLMSGAGSAATAMLAANKGGVIDPHHMEMMKIYHPGYADGGQVEQSAWDKVKSAFQEEPKSKKPDAHPLDQNKAKAFMAGGNFDQGGKVPAMVSPGEKYIPPQEAKEVAMGEKSIAQAGQKIPGDAKVKGDSIKNDTVPASLDEGGIVIPRSIMNAKDPVKEGTKFLVEALKKHGGKKEESDFKDALKKAIASRSK